MRKELILAQSYFQAGLMEAAQSEVEQVLVTCPDDPDARYILGSALERQGHPAQAVPHLRKAVEGNPDDPAMRHALGLVLFHQDCLYEALTHLTIAKDLGGDEMCEETLAACLMGMSRPDEAEPYLQSVAARRAEDPVVWVNLATALIDLNRCDEAVAACDRALALDPEHADAHMARSIAHLLDGKWEEAWPEYEWRWHTQVFLDTYPTPPCPRWTGEPLPEGSYLWVRGEQGYGDQIQFARFLPQAAEVAGVPVIVSANRSLHGLLSGLPGVAHCVDMREIPDGCAAEVPMQTLAERFAVHTDYMLEDVPYFPVPEVPSALRLPPQERRRLRVGVCWAGKPRPRDRAIDPAFLQPVFERLDVEVFSLQVGPSEYDWPADAGWVDMAPHLTDFSATAAVLSQLDAVVSVDTGVAHLAGAFGVPTALLLIHGADWRWLRDVGWTPWYPNTILMRQHERGNWARPVAMVEAILKQIQDSL